MPIVRKWVHTGHIGDTSGPPLEIPVRKAKGARSWRTRLSCLWRVLLFATTLEVGRAKRVSNRRVCFRFSEGGRCPFGAPEMGIRPPPRRDQPISTTRCPSPSAATTSGSDRENASTSASRRQLPRRTQIRRGGSWLSTTNLMRRGSPHGSCGRRHRRSPPQLAWGHRPKLPRSVWPRDQGMSRRIPPRFAGGESIQPPDAACEDVADGANAPRVGGVFVVLGHGRAECAMPRPLYFRGPKVGLPNRGRMLGGAMKNLAAPPEGGTARTVDRRPKSAEMREVNAQARRRREPTRPAAPRSATAPGAGIGFEFHSTTYE